MEYNYDEMVVALDNEHFPQQKLYLMVVALNSEQQ